MLAGIPAILVADDMTSSQPRNFWTLATLP